MRIFFKTISKRLKVLDPCLELDEARFHSPAPKRSYLTKREADLLLAAVDSQATKEASSIDSNSDLKRASRAARRKALAYRDHAAISVMMYAGLRIEETTALVVDDLDLLRGQEEIRVARGKGNKERRVPMSPKLKRSLRRWEIGSPRKTLRRTLYKYVRKSGLRKHDLHPHDLRRTFGTWFLQANPDKARELAELMGHSDLSQVMKYALPDEQRAEQG